MRRALLVLLAGCAGNSPGGDDDVDVDAMVNPDGAAPVAPTWSSDMTLADRPQFYTRLQAEGAVDLNMPDPAGEDGLVARLRFPGLPSLGNLDRVGPAYASELATLRDFHYGVYRTRVRLATCAPTEEVVNGIFTYFNDGADHDGDTLVDNAEIDLEILCGTPAVIFMTVWTEYTTTPTESFRKWTRAIDLATGDVWESPSDRAYGIERVGNDPALRLPQLLDRWVELGFEWRPDRVRFFARVGDHDQTLGELTDPAKIPSLPGALMFNVWHPADHWFGGGAPPDYPANDATMFVDWARYWQ